MAKFAVFDIDGTLIRWQLYHAITDALAKRGHVAPEAFQAMKAARMDWKKRTGKTFSDYEVALIAAYEAVLVNLSRAQLQEAIDAVFEEYKDQTYTYSRNLLNRLKSEGYALLAISGSQTEIIGKIAEYYGFLDYQGTVYEYAESKFTGKKTVASHNKPAILNQMVKRHGLTFDGSIALGDSGSDIGMLEMVKNPIAFNPETVLYEHAKKQGWKIVVERKNVTYELEKSDGQTYILA